MNPYNYESFEANDYELVAFNGPEMGQKAPDLTLSDLQGNPVQLLDFPGRFLVLEFGSITCPLFQSRRKHMAGISDMFPDVTSRVVYVREAHPGTSVPAHKSQIDKLACAQKLRDVDQEGREILVDDMDGTVHRAFGSYPNAVYIMNSHGCVVYRSAWNNGAATRRILRRLLAGKPVRAEGFFVPPRPPVALETFKQAGPGAALDFIRGLPRLAWNNLIKRNLRLVLHRRSPVLPDADC